MAATGYAVLAGTDSPGGGGSGAVSSVTGTALQITATPTTGAVVLSIPTSLLQTAAGNIGWASRSLLSSGGDGYLDVTNAAGNAFTMLRLGGTSSSFPAIKRNGTALNFRLADDLADAPITASTGAFSGDVTVVKRIVPNVTPAADATSITPNTDTANMTYQANTQTAGTLTINADGGTPLNGQAWILKIKSTNVQTFAWNGVYVGGTVALPTATTGSGKIDYFGFIYDGTASKWDYTGTSVGF